MSVVNEEQVAAGERRKLVRSATGPSLEEINGTVAVAPKDAGFLKSLLSFSGPVAQRGGGLHGSRQLGYVDWRWAAVRLPTPERYPYLQPCSHVVQQHVLKNLAS